MTFTLKSSFIIAIGLIFFMNIAAARTDEVIAGNQSQDIRVVLDNIFISRINESIIIFETVIFRNEGHEIRQSSDNHTYFIISTPLDAINLNTDAMECCLLQEDGVVYMDPMKSIKSGENFEMKISYELVPTDKEYVFNKKAIYNTTSLSLFVDENMGLDAGDLHGSMKLSGKEYTAITFHDMKAGDSVSMPVKISVRPGYFYPAAGLILFFLAGLVYHFRNSLFTRNKEDTLEELELEKLKIFRAIRGFEKHKGSESSEEYERLMEEYRQRGIEVLMKIDQNKSNRQSQENKTSNVKIDKIQ